MRNRILPGLVLVVIGFCLTAASIARAPEMTRPAARGESWIVGTDGGTRTAHRVGPFAARSGAPGITATFAVLTPGGPRTLHFADGLLVEVRSNP